MSNKTAILVDGGFFHKRANFLWGNASPEKRANQLVEHCMKHLSQKNGPKNELYRILYYDCPPMDKRLYHPLSQKTIDFSKTELYKWMNIFHQELRSKRKVALRLGELEQKYANYTFTPEATKKLCKGSLSLDSLKESHFLSGVTQKGVDMRLGVDVASISYKRQVSQIVLISGDSDFVPAAKLARREGIDFILDPMWAKIRPDLSEHIDGLWSPCENPEINKK